MQITFQEPEAGGTRVYKKRESYLSMQYILLKSGIAPNERVAQAMMLGMTAVFLGGMIYMISGTLEPAPTPTPFASSQAALR